MVCFVQESVNGLANIKMVQYKNMVIWKLPGLIRVLLQTKLHKKSYSRPANIQLEKFAYVSNKMSWTISQVHNKT